MSSKKKTTFHCDRCSREIRVYALNKKKKIDAKMFCSACLIRRRTMTKIYEAIPVEYHSLLDSNIISFDMAEKYIANISSSIIVSFTCIKCHADKQIRWCKLLERKHSRAEKICCSCLQSSINTQDSHLLAHRERSKKLWHRDAYRVKCIKAFQEHNKKMQLDVDYAQLHKRKSKSVTGELLVGDRFIKFDSGFELIYLASLPENVIIRRCNFPISYKNRYYHPDFLVIDASNKKTIVEIKGFYKNAVEEKQAAAIQYISQTKIADDYILYDTDRLLKEGILEGTGGGYFWKQIRKINNGRIIRFTDSKHQQIAEHGRNWRIKDSDNKKNREKSL